MSEFVRSLFKLKIVLNRILLIPRFSVYNSDLPGESDHCNNFSGETAFSGTRGSIGRCQTGDYNNGWWFCPLSDGTGRLYFNGDNFYRICLPNPSYEISSCLCSILPGCYCGETLVMTCAQGQNIKR
jgi:hypothetical protein